MSIFDVLKDRESKKTFEQMNAEAIKMFDVQKNAVKAIKDTDGYNEIKKFWEREKEVAMRRLSTASVADPTAQAMFALADNFLGFLKSRES